MTSLLKKLHLPAVVALVGNVIGISDLVATNKDAAMANLPHLGLSPEWAAVLVAACTLMQAVTRAVHAGDKTEIEKASH